MKIVLFIFLISLSASQVFSSEMISLGQQNAKDINLLLGINAGPLPAIKPTLAYYLPPVYSIIWLQKVLNRTFSPGMSTPMTPKALSKPHNFIANNWINAE